MSFNHSYGAHRASTYVCGRMSRASGRPTSPLTVKQRKAINDVLAKPLTKAQKESAIKRLLKIDGVGVKVVNKLGKKA